MATFRKKPINATKSLKSLHNQGLFLKRLGVLLLEGFSIKKALQFLKTISDIEIERWILAIESGMEAGNEFHYELKQLGFSEQVCSQIYFSVVHGNFGETIYHCGEQIINEMDRKKKMQQLLSYPVMLVIFIIGMLFAMRYILLPHIRQITTSNTDHLGLGTKLVMQLIDWSPIIIVGSVIVIILAILGVRAYLAKRTPLERQLFLTQLPVVGRLLQLARSQYLSYEWGQLIKHGVSIREIIRIMKQDENSLFLQELADNMEAQMLTGKSFYEVILSYEFLKEELAQIIQHGEVSSDLGKELMLYANQCEEDLKLKVERLMSFVQPVVFIGVAVMIVAIYAALLLPTFSLMEGLR